MGLLAGVAAAPTMPVRPNLKPVVKVRPFYDYLVSRHVVAGDGDGLALYPKKG